MKVENMNGTSTSLADELASQMSGGSQTAKARFSSKTAAFAWCADELVGSAAAYVSHGISGSTSTSALRVSKTADGAVWTTGEKPITNTIVVEDVALGIYPGVVQVKTSHFLDANSLGQAVHQSLYGTALQAFDNDLVTAAQDGAGVSVTGAASAATIAEAQAAIMASGFSPNLIIVSPGDYGTIVGTSTSSLMVGGNDARDAQLMMFGAKLVVSSALDTGSAVVLDRSAVVAVEHEDSPVALLDVNARTNSTDVVVELIAAAYVSRPDGVCSIAAA